MPATDRVKLKTETRGGAGRGQGRKTIASGGTKRVNVTIDDASRERLLLIGGGNLSAGIRIAAEAYPLE
ncbi:MAG: hypothetical protein HYU78_02310 [Rhodocyclales bacterium]|nr:hypothetical protein [Rhodocyclales bacterium]